MITLLQMSKFTGDFGTTLRGLGGIQPVQGGSGAGGGGAPEQEDRERVEGQGVFQALDYFNDKLLEQKTLHREQVLSQLKMKYEKKPGTVRAVTFTKKLSFGFEDALELLAEDGDGEFAKPDNLEKVNSAVHQAKNIITSLKKLAHSEYEAAVIAATSSLGWKVVEQIEGDMTLPDDVSVEGKELRKLEKEALVLQRERKASQRGGKVGRGYKFRGGFGYKPRGGFNPNWWPSYSRGAARGRGGSSNYKGGAGSGGKVCFKCGEPGHLIATCKK